MPMYCLAVEEWENMFESSLKRCQFFFQNFCVPLLHFFVLEHPLCLLCLLFHPLS